MLHPRNPEQKKQYGIVENKHDKSDCYPKQGVDQVDMVHM